jgi:hypothetical protein
VGRRLRGRKPRECSSGRCLLPARYHRCVRRLLTWLLVSLGIAALVRKLRRRAPAPEAREAAFDAPVGDDPADELRQKLAESRSDEAGAQTPQDSVEERRADVHAEGRATLDEMRSSSDD